MSNIVSYLLTNLTLLIKFNHVFESDIINVFSTNSLYSLVGNGNLLILIVIYKQLVIIYINKIK